MIQLYFLSIVCNGLSGYVLYSDDEGGQGEGFKLPLNNPTFHLVLGIMSIVTGVLKLLSPTMDGLPILGDLIPAAAGIISGLVLIFGIYRKNTSTIDAAEGSLENIGSNLLRFRKPLGLGLLAVSLIHFLFPNAIFL